MTSGREGIEASCSEFAKDAFRHDRAGAVAGAEKENIEEGFNHNREPSVGSKG